MDFNWTEAQLARKQEVIDFVNSALNDDPAELDKQSAFPAASWQKCADFGLQSMSVPEAFSGRPDTDFLTALLAMEGFGYACLDNGLAFALNAQMWTSQLPLVHAGTEEQKQKYLPGMSSGKIIGCHAMTEPDSGSDAYALQTTAIKTNDGYVLNGHKCFVSLAPIADLALICATVDPSLGKWGISIFLVDTKTAGCEVSLNREKLGLRSVPFGDIVLNDCVVPAESLLGAEGAGVSLSNSFLEWERCCILASQLGAMTRQLEDTIRHARERKIGNQSIGKFQSVSNRIVDMKLRLETAQLLLYKVAWLKSNGKNALTEAALLKLHISESFTESSLDALRIFGGYGYLSDHNAGRDLRDSIGGLIYAGTSDIQKNIVARMLGL